MLALPVSGFVPFYFVFILGPQLMGSVAHFEDGLLSQVNFSDHGLSSQTHPEVCLLGDFKPYQSTININTISYSKFCSREKVSFLIHTKVPCWLCP